MSEAHKARCAKLEGERAATAAAAETGRRAAKASRRGGARKMSAAARKRISDAQKARWAKVRARKGKAA